MTFPLQCELNSIFLYLAGELVPFYSTCIIDNFVMMFYMYVKTGDKLIKFTRSLYFLIAVKKLLAVEDELNSPDPKANIWLLHFFSVGARSSPYRLLGSPSATQNRLQILLCATHQQNSPLIHVFQSLISPSVTTGQILVVSDPRRQSRPASRAPPWKGVAPFIRGLKNVKIIVYQIYP